MVRGQGSLGSTSSIRDCMIAVRYQSQNNSVTDSGAIVQLCWPRHNAVHMSHAPGCSQPRVLTPTAMCASRQLPQHGRDGLAFCRLESGIERPNTLHPAASLTRIVVGLHQRPACPSGLQAAPDSRTSQACSGRDVNGRQKKSLVVDSGMPLHVLGAITLSALCKKEYLDEQSLQCRASHVPS